MARAGALLATGLVAIAGGVIGAVGSKRAENSLGWNAVQTA